MCFNFIPACEASLNLAFVNGYSSKIVKFTLAHENNQCI